MRLPTLTVAAGMAVNASATAPDHGMTIVGEDSVMR
jgi:hypothetical protein